MPRVTLTGAAWGILLYASMSSYRIDNREGRTDLVISASAEARPGWPRRRIETRDGTLPHGFTPPLLNVVTINYSTPESLR